MNSSDISIYEKSLLLSQPLREPIIKEIIQTMRLPLVSSGLDIGCGIGLNTFILAEVLGSNGSVIGIDAEEEFLAKAQLLLQKKHGLKQRVSFIKGDAEKLPFADKSFDWCCSIDCIGALNIDPLILLKELQRVVKPGGKVFIILWSSQMLLPGYPFMEAQLNATSAGIAPFGIGMAPDRHIMRAAGWFREAGFADIQARTFVRDIFTPLSTEIITAVTDLFIMRWGSATEEVDAEIWDEYQRLCRPDSPDFILHNPDYYAFFTYSVFSGQVV